MTPKSWTSKGDGEEDGGQGRQEEARCRQEKTKKKGKKDKSHYNQRPATEGGNVSPGHSKEAEAARSGRAALVGS